MTGRLPEASAQRSPRIFSQHIPLCEVVPSSQITERLELTQRGIPVEGISQPLVHSIRRGHWFSVEGGRIYTEVRNPEAFKYDFSRRLQMIRGVDFDDCLVSATGWHKREQQLMERFGVRADIGVELYEMSKILVPGRVVGERRYTPLLNMALMTVFTDLLRRGVPDDKAFDETSQWNESVLRLVQQHGEVAIKRLAVDPAVSAAFLGNPISRFLYRDFTNAVFDPQGPAALKFISTRGKIEGPLGQVHKIHTSGVLQRRVDMIIYTNDIKAETLIYLSNLVPPRAKRKNIFLFDDNVSEIMPYLEMAREQGMSNIWVVQVSHPDSKRRDTKPDLEPARVIGRENSGETVLRYYSTRPNLTLSRSVLFQV